MQLHESQPGSNTFMTRTLNLNITFCDILSDVEPRVAIAKVDSTIPGANGISTVGPEIVSETSPGSKVYSNANNTLTVKLVRITSNGPSLVDDLTAEITSSALSIENTLADAIESSPDSQEFTTELLHNEDKPPLASCPLGGAVITANSKFSVKRKGFPGNALSVVLIAKGVSEYTSSHNYCVDNQHDRFGHRGFLPFIAAPFMVTLVTEENKRAINYKPKQLTDIYALAGDEVIGKVENENNKDNWAKSLIVKAEISVNSAATLLNSSSDSANPIYATTWIPTGDTIIKGLQNRNNDVVEIAANVEGATPDEISWSGQGDAKEGNHLIYIIKRDTPGKYSATLSVRHCPIKVVTVYVVGVEFPEDSFKNEDGARSDMLRYGFFAARGASLGPINDGVPGGKMERMFIPALDRNDAPSQNQASLSYNADQNAITQRWTLTLQDDEKTWKAFGESIKGDPRSTQDRGPITEQKITTDGGKVTILPGSDKIQIELNGAAGGKQYAKGDRFVFTIYTASQGFMNNAEMKGIISPPVAAESSDIFFKFRRGRQTNTKEPFTSDENDKDEDIRKNKAEMYSGGSHRLSAGNVKERVNYVEWVDVKINSQTAQGEKCSKSFAWKSAIEIESGKRKTNVENNATTGNYNALP